MSIPDQAADALMLSELEETLRARITTVVNSMLHDPHAEHLLMHLLHKELQRVLPHAVEQIVHDMVLNGRLLRLLEDAQRRRMFDGRVGLTKY